MLSYDVNAGPKIATTPTFVEELEHLINRHSMENGSDTPDFILADFLANVLGEWNTAIKRREEWYGRKAGNGASILDQYKD